MRNSIELPVLPSQRLNFEKPVGPVSRDSSPELKVALFRSLFRGRPDVYPRRFQSRKTGKSGYQPACGNEWVRGICEKPKIKCMQCANSRFLPVTDEVIRWHLSGTNGDGKDFVMGVYPMLQDETCFFLAADFDKANWQEDVKAVLESCRNLNLAAYLERSRSGNAGHIWLFFSQAIPAALARRLGSYILTETMERRPEIGLDSYDRFFPNQDTLPRGGFGNLIALPLQKIAREQGNSVFLDDHMVPYPDQWAFLSQVKPIAPSRVEEIVQRAQANGRVMAIPLVEPTQDDATPWTLPPSRRRSEPPVAGPLPASIELVLGNDIYIAKDTLSPALRNRLVSLAAFQNPEFYKAQAMRLPTYALPRVIGCAEDHPNHIALPRGCLDAAQQMLQRLKIITTIRDERHAGMALDVAFHGNLRPEQDAAAKAMLAHDTGVLSATTSFGKTVLAAWLISQRRVNTLVLVHRKQLMEQWVARLSTFLNVPIKSIGRIGGGYKKPNGLLDVAVIQSLVRKGVVDDRLAEYGHIIVDECHHLSAHSFEQVTRRAKAKFVLGLSATLTRKDGHHPIILMQCGPIRHHVDARHQAAHRPFVHTVLVRPTGFRPSAPADADSRKQFQTLYNELVADSDRNAMICRDVLHAMEQGRSPILLTERNAHLTELAARLSPHVANLFVLRGGMGKKEIGNIASAISCVAGNEPRLLLATGKYIGEGFDDARLDTLFLTLPISWHGTIAQYVGRLHRLYDGKREVRVYDYADLNAPMLAKMFDRRCRGYEAVGYKILLPAGAVPGWPVEVPLPIDPQWKKEYAASVQRLIRDGVDIPLGNLFVHIAKEFPSGAQHENLARSATEAFLFRRLESLEQTAGLFKLNVRLPIAFDAMGQMEVDLLCRQAGIVLEIDGSQHLNDRDAYRRDRRKDQLLQENGYLVLRFLAEDIGKQLSQVLDAILRALTARQLSPLPTQASTRHDRATPSDNAV